MNQQRIQRVFDSRRRESAAGAHPVIERLLNSSDDLRMLEPVNFVPGSDNSLPP